MRLPKLASAAGFITCAAGISACGGNSTPFTNPHPGASPLALLVPGTVNQRSGTETVVVTFASPGPTTPNSSAAYTLAETDTISSAASGAPDPIDVHRVQTWTTTTAPTYGSQPSASTIDDYESVADSNGTQTVSEAATDQTSTGTNFSSILANGGSGAFSDTSNTTYSPAQVQAIYPQTTGSSFTQSLARTVNATTSTAAAAGTLSSSLQTVFGGDDSFTQTGTGQNGDAVNETESSNGSATVNNTGAAPFARTIGVPTNATGTYTIPITTNGTAASIADYYPGNALPPAPLGVSTVTIAGPGTSLPSGCSGISSYPNIVEADTATSELNVIAGSVTSGSARTFNSNGTIVCRTSTTTSSNYSLATGALVSTTVTNQTVVLTSTTLNSSARTAK